MSFLAVAEDIARENPEFQVRDFFLAEWRTAAPPPLKKKCFHSHTRAMSSTQTDHRGWHPVVYCVWTCLSGVDGYDGSL